MESQSEPEKVIKEEEGDELMNIQQQETVNEEAVQDVPAAAEPKDTGNVSTAEKRKLDDAVTATTNFERIFGISEYISHELPGFTGVLKERFSDFVVNEIDLDGNVVHLTDSSLPQLAEKVETPSADLSVISEEKWTELEELMRSDESNAVVTLNATDLSKEQRLGIHKAIRAKYPNAISNTKTAEGKSVIEVSKLKRGTVDPRSRAVKYKSQQLYTKFVLYKENASTMEAVDAISSRLRVKPGIFQYAGTKDKRAKTSQWITASKVDPERLLGAVNRDSRFTVGNFSFQDKPLRLGDLTGNRFGIVLRKVTGDEKTVEAAVESLKTHGFINYYGAQRFGTRNVATHEIGRQLLKGNWEEAIDLILKPPETSTARGDDVVEATKVWAETKNAALAYSKLTRSRNSAEGQLLAGLKQRGSKDLVGALNSIARNLRLTYIHAYQSFVWNTVASRRIANHGLQVLIGDLVLPKGTAESSDDILREGEEAQPSTATVRKEKVKPVFVTCSNIGDYSIDDVVLPLPGYEICYPENEIAQWYRQLLQQDDLADTGLKQSVKAYSLGGAYRRLIAKPIDLQWRFVRYDDATLSLIASDRDRLNKIDPHQGVQNGKHAALILQFSLPTSSYATMALREMTKTDTSAQFQASLSETVHNGAESKRCRSD